MYILKRRRIKKRKKISGRGIKRPYISKRNRLMLGKGQRGRGVAALAPYIISAVKSIADLF